MEMIFFRWNVDWLNELACVPYKNISIANTRGEYESIFISRRGVMARPFHFVNLINKQILLYLFKGIDKFSISFFVRDKVRLKGTR